MATVLFYNTWYWYWYHHKPSLLWYVAYDTLYVLYSIIGTIPRVYISTFLYQGCKKGYQGTYW